LHVIDLNVTLISTNTSNPNSKVSKALGTQRNCSCGYWQHCCVYCFSHFQTNLRAPRWTSGRSVLVWQPFVMEFPLSATAKCEVRAVIRFLNAKGVKPIEIHRQRKCMAGRAWMSKPSASGVGSL